MRGAKVRPKEAGGAGLLPFPLPLSDYISATARYQSSNYVFMAEVVHSAWRAGTENREMLVGKTESTARFI